MKTVVDYLAVLFGSNKWLNGSNADAPLFQAFLQGYQTAVDPKGDGGTTITAAEAANLKSLALPAQLTTDDVQTLIDRWNRTLDYNSRNIINLADVPAGQSTDFIALDDYKAKAQAFADAQASAVADGYTDPLDGLHQAELEIRASLLAPKPAGTCATVKIQLDQRVTLTRTGFKATLVLDNAPQNVALSNIKVTLNVTDLKGNDASSVFGISTPTVSGFAVDGTGALASGTKGTAVWTLLPAHEAAATGDTSYLVGGTLSYTQSGATVTIPLFPTEILVKPDPFLQFHYFLQRDIYGPDPFDGPDVPVKPSEPFSLGLIVKNAGLGTARNFQIVTGQPKVIENNKGLLIDFKLIGTQINDLATTPSLDINLGSILGNTTSVAQFLLTASLAGQFIDFSATYKHVDDLGNPRTSLIDSIDTHILAHVVRIDTPADDGKPDFLTFETPNINNVPDTVWNSVDASTAHVTAVLDALADNQISDSIRVVHVAFTAPTGYVYVQLNDPGQGNYRLTGVVRSDGKPIRLEDNAWLTSRVIRLKGQAPFVQNRLYLFDLDSTGSYTVTYAQAAPIDAPVGRLKGYSDGTTVVFGGSSGSSGAGTGSGTIGAPPPTQPMIVTAALSDGSLYAENLDRSAGIRIVPASGAGTAAEGALIRGTGTIRTGSNGERYLDTSTLAVVGSGAIDPLGLTTKPFYSGDYLYNAANGAGQQGMIGGAGLTPVGLLVRTIGKVTDAQATTFSLTDGFSSGGFSKTVQVSVPVGAVVPAVGSTVGVTGVVSTAKTANGLLPVLLTRRASDIVTDLSSLQGTFTSPNGTLNTGDNLLALPGVPFDPSPVSVLNHYTGTDGMGLLGRLNRYDAPTQSEVSWDAAGVVGPFGSFLSGEGYRFRINAGEPTTLTMTGTRTDFADQWLSLPKLGATRIGDPFAFSVDWSAVQVNDGTKMVSLSNAAQVQFPPWLSSKATYFNSVIQATQTLGLSTDTPDSTVLLPWLGYFVTGSKDNLALVVPTRPGVPVLESLSPSTAVAGSGAFTLTVSGSGFTSGASVYWNGAPLASTSVSDTQLTASVPAADLTTAGSAQVTVQNTAAGPASGALPFTITPASSVPTPVLTSLNPAATLAGSLALTLSVNGHDFVSGATVFWNGSARPTTFVSPAQLTAAITSDDVQTAGAAAVSVKNTPGGAESNKLGFTITAKSPPSPVPVITTLSPSAATAGDSDTTVNITGTGFLALSTVTLDGQGLSIQGTPTASQIQVKVTAAQLATARAASLVVTNPVPTGGGGGPSAPAVFTVNPKATANQPPSVSLTAPVNGASYTAPANVTLTATASDPDGTVAKVEFYNGSTLIGTATSSPYSAALSGLASGTYTLTAKATDDGGASTTSTAVTITVNDAPAPVPAITGLSPSSAASGAGDTALTISGSGFVAGSHVSFHGAALSPASVNAGGTAINVTVPAAQLAAAGVYPVTVTNDASSGGGGGTASKSFTVNNPVPNNPVPVIGALTPASAAPNAALTLTILGQGFVAASTVTLSGGGTNTTLTPSAVTATQLTVNVPATALPSAGSYTVTVTNPAPGGGTSGPAALAVGLPKIRMTATLTRTGGSVVATVTLKNTGSSPTTALKVTAAKLRTGATTVALPLVVSDLAPGETRTVALTFPGSVASGTGATLQVTCTYSGLTTTGGMIVTVP